MAGSAAIWCEIATAMIWPNPIATGLFRLGMPSKLQPPIFRKHAGCGISKLGKADFSCHRKVGHNRAC
jgi:hypothetical protein